MPKLSLLRVWLTVPMSNRKRNQDVYVYSLATVLIVVVLTILSQLELCVPLQNAQGEIQEVCIGFPNLNTWLDDVGVSP